MPEPGRAPKIPAGFETTYSKRLKTRFATDALKKVTTSTAFKSPKNTKTKLKTQFENTTVSKNTSTLTLTNPGVSCLEQEAPWPKIPKIDLQVTVKVLARR